MAKSLTPGGRTAVAFLSFGVQVAPTSYVVATATVPPWARWTLGVFIGAWTLMTLANAAKGATR